VGVGVPGAGAEGTGTDVATPVAPDGSGGASAGGAETSGNAEAIGSSTGDGDGVDVPPVHAQSATIAKSATARVSDGSSLDHYGGGGKPS
jgi:hypothetical protein